MISHLAVFLLTFSLSRKVVCNASSLPRGCDPQLRRPHVSVTTNQGESLHVVQNQLIVPVNTTSFNMNCTFHIPIKWEVFKNQMPNLAVMEETIAHFSPSTWPLVECFSANLVFYEVREEITGIYTCSAVGSNSVSVSLFSGHRLHDSPGFLLRRGRIHSQTINQMFNPIFMIRMDCHTTHPAVQVQLYFAKQMTSQSSGWTLVPEKFVHFQLDGSPLVDVSVAGKPQTELFLKCQTNIPGDYYIVHFIQPNTFEISPNRGLTEILTLSTSFRQKFKCVAKYNISMTVVKSIPGVQYNTENTFKGIRSSSLITLDFIESETVSNAVGVIQCNSNNGTLHSWNHRLFHDTNRRYTSIDFFLDPKTLRATCVTVAVQDAKILFVTASTSEQAKFKETCTEVNTNVTCPDQLLLSPVQSTTNSISVHVPLVSGKVVCHSLDINKSFQYFLNVDEKTISILPEFSDYGDLEYTKHVSHTISCSTRDVKVAESVECKCTFSKRLFALPIIPVIPWNNGTLQCIAFTDVPFFPSKLQHLSFHYKVFRVNIPSADVKGVSCMGFRSMSSKHNFADWTTTPKQHKLHLEGSEENSVIEISDDQYSINISCVATSYPKPQITWNISQTILNASAALQLFEKAYDDFNSSSLTIESTITLNVEDALRLQQVECVATVDQITVGGEIHFLSRTFQFKRLTLQTENQWSQTTTVAVSISSIAAFLLLLGVIFLVIKDKCQKSPLTTLSVREVDYFLQGNPNIRGDGGYENAQRMAFAGTKYQMDLSCLQIHHDKILGSGAYGMVVKGSVQGISDTEVLDVAVKMVKPGTDIEYFKALLGELKVMTYIGKHSYIAELIGAVATRLNKCQLFVVLALYPNGSLKDYLRNNRNSVVHNCTADFKDLQKYQLNYENVQKPITSQDLAQWSYEIALGMDYLESKKVIHGDLATRNILLDGNRRAKISDFGLARQLYNYSLYIKKSKVPLPWRWMSIEAICKMTFSSKSDVWAYGVTVWEIFSLGEQPFPVIDFDREFINLLKNGHRLTKPELASEEIYNHIMFPTWNLDPEARPTFLEQSNTLERLLKVSDYLEGTPLACNNEPEIAAPLFL